MRRVEFFILMCVLFIGSSLRQALCQVGTWRTFTNTNYIQDISAEGDTLWLATTGGTVAFDVHSARFIATCTNVHGLGHVDVTSVTIDRDGHIWLSTNGGGVSTWDRSEDTWRTYAVFDGVALGVNTLREDGAILWVGTDEGVSLFQWGWDWEQRDTTFVWKENYDSRNGLPSDVVTAFAADRTTIWVGTSGGVASARKTANLKDPMSWTRYTMGDGLPSARVLSLAVTDAYVWAGTDKGLAVLKEEGWVEAGFSDSHVHSLDVLSDTLWAATSSGVFKRRGDEWIGVGNETLPSQDVRAVARAGNGRIVCGTWGGGLSVYDGNGWSTYASGGPWANNCVLVMVDRDGSAWCSMRGEDFIGAVSRYSGVQWTDYEEDDGIEVGEQIVSMMEDDQGRKWFGAWGDGASRLDDKGTVSKDDDEWVVFNSQNSGLHTIPEAPNFEVITGIEFDGAGNIWFANFGVGVVVCDPADDVWETFTPADRLVDRLVLSLALGDGGVVWMGALQNGASRLTTAGTPFLKEDDEWQSFNEENGLTNAAVNAILTGADGSAWLGTHDGLFRYEEGHMYRNNNVENVGVLCLERDAMDNVWVGTSTEGIFVLDRQGFLEVHYHTANSGLVNNEVRSLSFNEETGEVWIATPVGLSRYESGIMRPIGEAEKVNFYPNPFIASEGHETVTFFQLPDDPSLRIYTISGELVADSEREGQSPVADPIFDVDIGRIRWYGTNQYGERVNSGVYIAVVTAPGVRPRTGKLAVIR